MLPPPPLLALLLLLIRPGADAEDPCKFARTCGECIRLHPSCVWCIGRTVKESECVQDSSAKCTGERRIAPASSTSPEGSGADHEITPQRIHLSLRVGETRDIRITYRKKEDYPLDLYYLMDLSSSMNKYKETLARLGLSLAEEMLKVTSNFQLGFGSFVDKMALPFVDMADTDSNLATPYSFKHHLSLQNSAEHFSELVKAAKVSTNLDTPEGGFDALMQAMVCEEIGWRDGARHLLIFSTDAAYHSAGDGKLVGAVERNDESCHLYNNEYTHSVEYDYPSISQIKNKVKEKEIILIFVVTENMKATYERLSDIIPGSQLRFLDSATSNIVSTISDAYKQFDKRVEMSDNASSAGISVTYEVICPGRPSYITAKGCEGGVVPNVDIPFRINITVPACPASYQETTWTKTIKIQPIGTNHGVDVNLEVHCGCPCEKPRNKFYEGKSPKCTSQGTYTCGVCSCDGDWIGEECNCKRISNVVSRQDDCKSNKTGKVCNDRGACVCGQCACEQRDDPEEIISGKYCDCDNFSCDRFVGVLCSGPDRGRCECGKCVCLPEWTGDSCECRHETNCVAPGDDEHCSGNGNCFCGKCTTCAPGYTGKYCGDVAGQPGGRCTELKDCVECTVHGTGKHAENNCSTCTYNKTVLADVIKEEELKAEERHCRLPDDSGCTFVFKYLDVEENLIITAERKKECPEPLNMIAVVAGVSGSILLIGLLTLLIWKIFTTLHDKREFARYQDSLSNTKWAALDNPLHQPSTTTVQNPTFRPQVFFST